MSNFQNTKAQPRRAWVPPTTVRLNMNTAKNNPGGTTDIADLSSKTG
jgi:hypothetical protein